MYDLIRTLYGDHIFKVLEYLKLNPGSNASKIASDIGIHTATVQSYLNVLDKYGIIKSEIKKGLGRPSNIYNYVGGSFNINFDELIEKYSYKDRLVRDYGNENIKYSYDIDKEIINDIIIIGKKKETMKFDSREGRFLWLLPPPDSKGDSIENLCNMCGITIMESVDLVLSLNEKGVVEIL